jgi:hypothetical protein
MTTAELHTNFDFGKDEWKVSQLSYPWEHEKLIGSDLKKKLNISDLTLRDNIALS